MKNYKIFITLILGVALLYACKKTKSNNTNPLNQGLKLNASSIASGTPYKIELWSKYDSFFVGYNTIYLGIKDTTKNQYIQSANISIRPYMPQMPMMGVAMPFVNPSNTAQDNFFVCGAGFIMYGNSNVTGIGPWNLEVSAKIPGVQDMINATCSFNVPQLPADKSKRFETARVTFPTVTSSGYFGFLINPMEWKIGMQPLKMRIFKQVGVGATSYFIPDDSLVVSNLYPWMPDMGHSSPNNIDPILQSNNEYQGMVNFTMTGLWHITFNLKYRDMIKVDSFSIVF